MRITISKLTFNWVIILLVLLASTRPFAQVTTDTSSYLPHEWSAQLVQINQTINSTTWTIEAVDKLIQSLTDMRSHALACVKTVDAEIGKLEKVTEVSQLQVKLPDENPTTQRLAGIDKEKRQLSLLRSDCKLVILRVDETIVSMESIHQRLIRNKILTHYPVIWENITNLPGFNELIEQLNMPTVIEKLVNPVQAANLGYSLLILLGAGLLCGIVLSVVCRRLSRRYIIQPVIFNLLLSISNYAITMVPTIFLALFFCGLEISNVNAYYPQIVLTYLIIYQAALAFTAILFCPPYPARALINIADPVPRLLIRRLFYLYTLILIYYLAHELIDQQLLSTAFLQFSGHVFIALLSVSLISIIMVINKLPKLNQHYRSIGFAIRVFFGCLLAFILVSDWSGYHIFAIYLVTNIALSLIMTFIAWILYVGSSKLINLLNGQHYYWQQQFRYALGLQYNSRLYEAAILTFLSAFIIWGGYIASLMKIWVLSQGYFERLLISVYDGFMLAGMIINPIRMVIGTLIFCVLSLTNRLIKMTIERRQSAYEDGRQIAIASIVGYLGFTIILILSLVIAGFNFTGLAIIAGALSVGIGFGLQNIVNNFISGLMLLIESPIRPGDRITIGDIEGIVRRIHLRATEITTLTRATVYVPNSDLISKNVTNFVIHNHKFGITCSVGVSYHSDLDKVKRILLLIAQEHPGVSQEPADQPRIFLKSFGDSSINIDLFCVINNVNDKFIVLSDINFRINEEFKRHNITIPFPQREIQIKKLD